MVFPSLPKTGVMLWENFWHIIMIVLLGAVVWFAKEALNDFVTSQQSGDETLAVEIEEGDKRVLQELEASANRQAAHLAEVGKSLTAELQVLRDRQAEDRESSKTLTAAVADLATRTAVLEDRSVRE